MSNYVIWKNIRVPNACSLTDFEALDNTFPLWEGTPLQDSFPSNASFHMRPDDPDDMLLTDSLENTEMIIVGSQRLVDFFREYPVANVEYLPVVVYDHKGKRVKQKYHIIHPIHAVDCLDRQKSGVTYSPILKTMIDSVERFVLQEDKIPADRAFFRCQDFFDDTLVRRDFTEALDKENFSGWSWLDVDDYS